MKRLAAFVFPLVTVLSAGPAGAQVPAPRTISVNGNAEVRVAPNEVILTVGVETDAFEIARARAENDRRVKAIAEAARGQGIAADHVKTDFLDIQPRIATTRRGGISSGTGRAVRSSSRCAIFRSSRLCCHPC